MLMVAPDLPDPPERGLTFIESLAFSPLADEFLGDDGRQDLQNQLLENPKAGKVIENTGGARKIRVALEGRGKRGGGRVIYYYQDTLGKIHFLLLYPKNQQDNLSAPEKKTLKRWIENINTEA